MNQKRLFIFLVLFLIFGLPALGVLSTYLARYNQNVPFLRSNSMMGTGAGQAVVAGRPMMVEKLDSTDSMVAQTEPMMAADRSLMMPPIEPPFPDDQGFVPGVDRTIVKNASLSLVVDDVRKTVDQVSQITQTNSGLITSSNVYDSEFQKGAITASIVLRVPVDKLDDTLAKFRGLANKVLQESVSADDRTKQKVDIEAQLSNLRSTEEQLRTILKQAKDVNETLQVQRELNSVRGQIERMDAQLQNLTNDAAMSTVTLNITTTQSELPPVGPQQNSILEEIKIALRDMVRLYRNLFIGGVRTTILLLPLIVIGAVAWFVWQRRAKKA